MSDVFCTRKMLLVTVVLATTLAFGLGIVLERSVAGESHPETVAVQATPEASSEANEGSSSETKTHKSGELSEGSTATEPAATHTEAGEQRILGINPESNERPRLCSNHRVPRTRTGGVALERSSLDARDCRLRCTLCRLRYPRRRLSSPAIAVGTCRPGSAGRRIAPDGFCSGGDQHASEPVVDQILRLEHHRSDQKTPSGTLNTNLRPRRCLRARIRDRARESCVLEARIGDSRHLGITLEHLT